MLLATQEGELIKSIFDVMLLAACLPALESAK
jgi:hypothetical protein